MSDHRVRKNLAIETGIQKSMQTRGMNKLLGAVAQTDDI